MIVWMIVLKRADNTHRKKLPGETIIYNKKLFRVQNYSLGIIHVDEM